MPYRGIHGFPEEYASKIGHINLIQSKFIQSMMPNLRHPDSKEIPKHVTWNKIQSSKELNRIIVVDGSKSTQSFSKWPYGKYALLNLAVVDIEWNKLQQSTRYPNPEKYNQQIYDSADFFGTIFPLRHLQWEDLNTYNTIRKIAYATFKAQHNEELLMTLKWLSFEMWRNEKCLMPEFKCPHCSFTKATIPYNKEIEKCSNCGNEVYLTDYLGLHLRMTEDGGPESLADEFLLILETLSIFNKIRKVWEEDKKQFSNILFLKDGPLQFRAHYTKLTNRIRNFFEYARKSNIEIFMAGQEKSGLFYEHLYLIGRDAPSNSYFVPNNKYIQNDIHQIPNMPPYGKYGNYGAKVFVNYSPKEQMVLTIPIGLYKTSPKFEDLIGGSRILSTIKKMKSSKYLGGIVPISIAHSLASLSQNPSGFILSQFSKKEISN